MDEKRPWIQCHGEKNPPWGDYCAEGYIALAYFVDEFRADKANRLLPLSEKALNKLLELRVFDEKSELWVHRSHLGEELSWRVASEEFAGVEMHTIETRQLLDLGEPDEKAPVRENGLRVLHTVSDHAYKLPIGDRDKYVKLMNYIEYDENGVASAVDYRLAGFCEGVKENAGRESDKSL